MKTDHFSSIKKKSNDHSKICAVR